MRHWLLPTVLFAATLAGRSLPAQTSGQLDLAWDKIGKAAPIYVGYRTKTDRDIPVVRLRAIT